MSSKSSLEKLNHDIISAIKSSYDVRKEMNVYFKHTPIKNNEPKIIVKKTMKEEQTRPLEHDKEYNKKVLRGMHKSNALYMKRFNKINKLGSPV